MNDKSMLEVAVEIMNASSEPKNIYKLIDEVMEKLGLGDDTNAKAQLYIDITTCADFVFLGGEDDLWDLKTRQPLEAWDKSFYENESEDFEADEEDEGEDISMEDYNYVEDDSDEEYEESDEDEDEDESTYEIDESLGDEDEDEDEDEESWDEEDDENSWDEDEEEKYNDMMDDYEDLYEDK